MVMQSHALNDERYWTQPKQFRPERFLENGKFLSTRPKAFIPFGVGRRVCLGEKLAISDLFLVLVRFLQKTADYGLVLEDHDQSILDPDDSTILQAVPKPFKISLTSNNVKN